MARPGGQHMKIRSKNWSAFQHYRYRAPPWIKPHRQLLEDYLRIPIEACALAPLLWLAASADVEGIVEAEPALLAFRLRLPVDEVTAGLHGLMEAAFSRTQARCWQAASWMLAPCLCETWLIAIKKCGFRCKRGMLYRWRSIELSFGGRTMKPKSLSAVAGLLIASAGMLSPATASTTFTYTGQDFIVCVSRASCPTTKITGSFTTSLTGSQIDNLSDADISATVTAFSFTSLLGTLTSPPRIYVAFFSTDANGNPTSWVLEGCTSNPCTGAGSNFLVIDTESTPSVAADFVESCTSICTDLSPTGENNNKPGTWTVTTDVAGVPEPSLWAMMLMGLGGIGFAMRNRRKAVLGV
jgi:hypothetical protein